MIYVLKNLDWSVLTEYFLSVIPVLLCVTIHETCHGYAALKMGDTTARDMGRLSLNPLKHLDPLGTLMMLVFGFGWARPVPINPRYFKCLCRQNMVSVQDTGYGRSYNCTEFTDFLLYAGSYSACCRTYKGCKKKQKINKNSR